MKKIFTLVVMCAMTAMAWAAQTTINFATELSTVTESLTYPNGTYQGFTFAFEKGNSGSDPVFFINNTVKEVRLYSGTKTAVEGNAMTVTSGSGNMTGIVLSGGSNFTYGSVLASTGEVSFDSGTRTLTWVGDAASVTFTVARADANQACQLRFTTAAITTGGEPGELPVAAPTFSRPTATYYNPIEVEISCSTEGASIYYTLDGTDPSASSTLYAEAIALSQTTTLKAIAIAEDGRQSEISEATYTFEDIPSVENIAAFNALADNTAVRFANPVTVLAQYSRNLYVMDASGYMLVYGSIGQTYKNGDVIPAGFSGTKVTYNGKPELSSYSSDNFQPATETADATAETVQCVDVAEDMWGHYVLIKGATLDYSARTITDASGSAPIFNSMGGYTSSTDFTKTYDVYAIIGSYLKNGEDAANTVYQVLPVLLDDNTPAQEVDDIAALYELAEGAKGKITGNITAIYQNGNRLWVKDASTYALVYGNVEGNFTNGDVITGAEATWSTFQNAKQITPTNASTWVAASHGDAVEPEAIALEEISQDMVHTYVLIENATITAGADERNFTINDGTLDMALYNQFNNELTITTGEGYNVEGFVALHSGVMQIVPIKVTAGGEELAGDVNGDGLVDASDVTTLIAVITGTTTSDRADVNGDGVIDASDVTALIGIVLGN